MNKIQSFIRWLFPATAKTVSRREGERRMRNAEDRWAAEDRFIRGLAKAAMRRKQDEDWASWTPEQRQKARLNGEYYGEERF